jgi:MFS family permease
MRRLPHSETEQAAGLPASLVKCAAAGTSQHQPKATTRSGALVLVLGCQLMIVLDGTMIYMALPLIRADLGLSTTLLSWVQNAYMLAVGGFLLLGARASDLIGQRRVFVAANASFIAASVAAGLASSALWLVGARGMQGLAAAFAAPSAFALLMTLFPEGPVRTRAIGLFTAVSGGGSALGLVLGGAFGSFISWRATLFVNLPIGVMLVALSPRWLPDAARQRGRFDLAGALSATVGMTALIYGLVLAAHEAAPRIQIAAALIAAATLLSAFVAIERSAQHPIVPLALFRSARRSGAYAIRTLLIGGMLGTFFYLTQYVQGGLGFSAFEAGFVILPLSVVQFLMVIYVVPRPMRHVGGTPLLAMGLATALCGMLGLSRVGPDTQLLTGLALPIVLLGLGTGAALVPLAAAGVAEVDARHAGAAAGLLNATHYLGSALGTAILVFLVSVTRKSAGVESALAAKLELAHALSVAASGSAVFFLLALVICAATMRSRR